MLKLQLKKFNKNTKKAASFQAHGFNFKLKMLSKFYTIAE